MTRKSHSKEPFVPKRARSTRTKIKEEALRLVMDIEKMQERLQKIDGLAQGRSEVVTQTLPGLVLTLETVKPLLERFHESL